MHTLSTHYSVLSLFFDILLSFLSFFHLFTRNSTILADNYVLLPNDFIRFLHTCCDKKTLLGYICSHTQNHLFIYRATGNAIAQIFFFITNTAQHSQLKNVVGKTIPLFLILLNPRSALMSASLSTTKKPSFQTVLLELMAGFEPATSSLPRMRSTY